MASKFSLPQRVKALVRSQASTAATSSQLTNQNRSPAGSTSPAARSVARFRTESS